MKVPAKVVLSKPLHHNASRVPGVFELRVYAIGQGPQLEAATEAFEALCKDFEFKLVSLGVETISARGELRAFTGDEALTVIPRKKHYASQGRHICSTEHVSAKNLTTDPDEVTCRLCRKLMG